MPPVPVAPAALRRAAAPVTHGLAVVRRPLARALGHATPLGWTVFALAVLGILAGRRLGWDELVTGGVTLAGLLVISIILTLGRSTYSVELDLADRRVTVGQRALGRIAVTNVGRSRMLPAEIELPVGAGAASFEMPSMAAGAVHEEVFAVPTARRAVVVVGPVRSVRGDALGLVRRQLRWTEPEELYIHPRIVSLASARTGVMRDLEGQTTRVVSENDMSFHALREYVAGDDRRNIHWRTSARLNKLMVRQYEDTRRTHTALALEDSRAAYLDEDEYEAAVEVFASLGAQAVREGLEITALSGEDVLRTGTPPRFLDDCAGLTSRPGPTGPGVTRTVAQSVPHASMVIVVTGSVPDAAELRRSALHVPAGVRTAIIVVSLGHELRMQTLGRLSVAHIGDLADLPRLVSRLVSP
jgi:hypothetical protein